MKLQRLEIKNLRCFDSIDLLVNGESLFFISENGGGKTSLFSALAWALGRGSPALTDFRDPNLSMEIIATFGGLDANEQAELTSAVDFTTPPILKVGVQASWDASAEIVDVTHGFPTHNWRRPSRSERDAMDFFWLPAWRDPTKLTSFTSRVSALSQILEGLPIGGSLQTALKNIRTAIASLNAEPELTKLFGRMSSYLSKILPGVAAQAYDLGNSALSDRDLLAQLELLLTYDSPYIAADRQSSGLAQLTVFALINELSVRKPGALFAVDEPEVSLHPHAQRALYQAISNMPNQALVATHSSNLMERVDPRKVVRLARKTGQVVAARPTALTDEDATALARYSSPETAEALFAKRIIFVEGMADRLALTTLASKTGRLLDPLGISIVALNGADTLRAFLRLFGPAGFDVPVCGLCDLDHQSAWSKVLESIGFGSNLTGAQMKASGFFIADRDLEDELIKAIGAAEALKAIDEAGHKKGFETFCKQAPYKGMSSTDQLKEYFGKRKVLFAPILASKIKTPVIGPLEEVLAFAVK